MTQLHDLPEDVQARIQADDADLREDLRLLPRAEEMGYKVEFRGGHWHNPASFITDNRIIWQTGRGWQAKSLITRGAHDVVFEREARVYGPGYDGLYRALLQERLLASE